MFYVYVLKSQSSGRRYLGYTSNLKKRLDDHNTGESRYTKNRGPGELAYKELHVTKTEALKREKFLKSGKGREFLDKIML